MSGVSYNPMNGRLTAGPKSLSYEVAKPQKDSSNQWTGTENNRNNARNVNFNNGNANNNNKYNGNVVRPVAASQDYDPPKAFVDSVWDAYKDCLKGKMRSKQAVEYMEIAEEDIPVLAQELWRGTYHPGTSTCFLGSLSETKGGLCRELQGPHCASLDMLEVESVVRGTLRETWQCQLQLPQGVWYRESRTSCCGWHEEGELQLSQTGLGVQRRPRWILHVDRQGFALVSVGEIYPKTEEALRAGRLGYAGQGYTHPIEDVINAGNVLGHSLANGESRGHAPSGERLRFEYRPAGVGRAGDKQESVYKSDRGTYRKPYDAVVRQFPDVTLRRLRTMALSEEELLHCAVRGRFHHCLRRPAFPCCQFAEDRVIPEWQAETDVTQKQEVFATSITWSEICRDVYKAREIVSVKPNFVKNERALPWICEEHGTERIGGLGQGTYGTDAQFISRIYEKAQDLQIQKRKYRGHGSRLLAQLLCQR